MRWPFIMGLVVALAGAVAAEAVAEPSRSTLVAVSGAGDDDALRVGRAIASAVEDQGWSVSIADADDTATIAVCALRDPTQCVPDGTLHIAAASVIFVHAESSRGDDGEPRVLLRGRLLDRDTGAVLGTSQRHCLRCRDADKLAQLGAELAAELVRTRESRLYPHTGIKVVATPADAVVSLDGVDLGPAGQVYRLAPGPHDVTVRRDGYDSSTHRVGLRPNQELVLEVELAPAGGVDALPEPRLSTGSSRALPWLGIGVSVAVVAGGTTLVAMHQDEVRDGTRRPSARNSRPWGVAAMSVGAVAGAASGYWLWRQRTRGRSEAIGLAPSAGGGVIVWTGVF